MNQTTIFLTDEEARLYVEFVKHRKNINILLNSGVFNVKNGSFEVHLDVNGEIRVIDTHNHLRL
jgi:hypothetical protein